MANPWDKYAQKKPWEKYTTAPSDATSQTDIPKPQPESGMGILDAIGQTLPIAGTNIPNIAVAPKEKQGAYAKTVISTALPFLAGGVTNPIVATAASGALGATGDALGTKVSDLITGQRTQDVTQNALKAGLLTATGEGIGRGLVTGMGKGLTAFSKGYDPALEALSNKYGMTLPASAVTTNRAVPLLESVAGKSVFGNKLTQMTMKAEETLTKSADDFISRLGSTPDASNVGIKVSEGMNNYRSRFMDTKNALYDAAKINKGDVTIKPQETIQTLNDIISEINNTANPDKSSLQYFQTLKNGLSGAGEDMRGKLVKQGFNPSTVEKIMGQQSVQDGVDGTTVLNTIKQIRRDTNPRLTTPVATGFESELRKVGATLSNEFDGALSQSRPDLADALGKANSAYKDGISKLNSEFGKNIKKLSDSKQYDKIAETVLNKSTSVDDIPRIFEVVGDQGKDALKANLADRMLGEAKRNARGVFAPSSIDRTIKQFGDARMKAIYTPEEYQALQDISKLTYAVGSAQKVAEGSQTTFTAKVAGLVPLAIMNPPLALKLLASDAAFSKAITSGAGQQMLRGGFKLPQIVNSAIPASTRVLAQEFGRQQ